MRLASKMCLVYLAAKNETFLIEGSHLLDWARDGRGRRAAARRGDGGGTKRRGGSSGRGPPPG